MADQTQAVLNGIAAQSMYEMLRKGQTFKLPSVLANFIASDGWKQVEFLDPGTNTKRVAEFDCFTDWATHSPARGGLGSQVHLIAEYITQPMDVDSAPDCTVKLAQAEPALLPKLKKVAAANQQAGVPGWTNVVDQLDELQGVGTPGPKKSVDNVHRSNQRPAGNSAAAGLRKLRRYSSDAALCKESGTNPDSVTEQYTLTIAGEKSVHRALIDCGLKKRNTIAAGLGIDGDPADVARRIVKRLGKARAAQLVNALTALLNDGSN